MYELLGETGLSKSVESYVVVIYQVVCLCVCTFECYSYLLEAMCPGICQGKKPCIHSELLHADS